MNIIIGVLVAVYLIFSLVLVYSLCVIAGKSDDELEEMGIRRS